MARIQCQSVRRLLWVIMTLVEGRVDCSTEFGGWLRDGFGNENRNQVLVTNIYLAVRNDGIARTGTASNPLSIPEGFDRMCRPGALFFERIKLGS
jgi:hypothetical protein